jgi:hypothetical protein
VWRLAPDYVDLVYEIASQLPRIGEYKLRDVRKGISAEQPWLREDRPVCDIDVERS